MREMKDSGFGWLREIPLDWDVLKIKDGFTRKKAKAFQNNPVVLSLARSGVRVRDISTNEGQLAASYYEYNPVTIDDMLLNPMDLQSGANCSISKVDGVISPAYVNLRYKKGFNPVFYDYYFKYQYWSYAFFSYGKGVSFDNRWTLNEDTLMNLPLLVPSKEEQDRIATYLDEQCKKIDEIMADIQSQIDTLEDYKKSVVSEAVTKGLDPDVVMKDSGIAFVGKIPAHWELHPVYYYFSEGKIKNTGCTENNLLSLSYGNIIRKDINTSEGLLPASFSTYNIVEKDDIIIRPTDLQNDKRSLRTGLVKEKGIITSAYIDLKPKTNVNSRYFHYLLHSYDVKKVFYNMGNGVRQGLNFCEFSKLSVFNPPIKEQEEIAEYLDNKCAKIDSIIEDKKTQLEIIESYKKSLIYEYVTGKKEVPENE